MSYCALLDRVRESLRRKRPGKMRKGIIFLHDNARPHTALATRNKIAEMGWTLMPQPPYSPDVAPCDFGLFALLKRPLKGHRCDTDEELKSAVKNSAKQLPIEAFRKWIAALPARYQKIIDCGGDYFV
jgi:histone-lysine N-methyltransferase SETMAR